MLAQQIHAAEPSLDMEFTQILQDMIGDLSNSPEPIQIKLFSNDQNLLLTLGPRVQQAIAKIPGVVDTAEWRRQYHQRARHELPN